MCVHERLIKNLVSLLHPQPESRQRLLAHHRNEWNGSLIAGKRHLLVDKFVIEADLLGVFASVREKYAGGSRPVDRSEAHRTRLAGRVDVAAFELERVQLPAGLTNSDDLGM